MKYSKLFIARTKRRKHTHKLLALLTD